MFTGYVDSKEIMDVPHRNDAKSEQGKHTFFIDLKHSSPLRIVMVLLVFNAFIM